MGRYPTKSNSNYGGRSEKSSRLKTTRYDESDHSSFLSDRDSDSRDGSQSSQFSYKGGRSSSKNVVVYSSDSDDSYNPTKRKVHTNSYRERSRSKSGSRAYFCNDDSDSDQSSVYEIKERTLIGSGSDRVRGAPRKRSESRKAYNSGSSGVSNSDDHGNFSSRINRIRRDQDESSFSSGEESESDQHSSRHVANSRRKSRRRGSDSNLMQPPRRSLNRRQQKSTRSISQKASTLNQSFNGLEQIQIPVPLRNNSRLMGSASVRSTGKKGRSFFPGQQTPLSGMLVDNSLLNQGQGQRMAEISGNNLRGNLYSRSTLGSGNMMRSMSSRSMNTYSLSQEQLNRSAQDGVSQLPIQQSPAMMRGTPQRSVGNANVLPDTTMQRRGLTRGASDRSLGNVVHPPIQPNPAMMRGTPQRSVGNANVLPDNSMQRRGLMRGTSDRSLGNVLPSTSMYSQQPGLMRGTSQRNLGNNDALLNTSIKCQRTGLMKGGLHGSSGNIDGLHNASMHFQQHVRGSSQSALTNNNPLLNNKTMHSQRPGLIRGSSQRSTRNSNAFMNASSVISNPNKRMNSSQQSYVGTKNAQRTQKSTKPHSVNGDSVLVKPSTPGDASVISSKSRRSLPPPRRSSPPQTLADQIYSRSRYDDTQSIGSYADPPGVDCNQITRKKNQRYSDDASYESLGDNQEGYVASNDPPDMFDDDRINNGVLVDKLEPDEGRNEYPPDMFDDDRFNNGVPVDKLEPDEGRNESSYESSDDQEDFYSEDESSASTFDEGDKYNYKIRMSSNTADTGTYCRESGGSISSNSVSSSRSAREPKIEIAPGKSDSRFSSDLAFEYEQKIAPPQRTPSMNFERVADLSEKYNCNKNRLDVIDTTSQKEPRNWLVQQISIRKPTDSSLSSSFLEPKGTSISDQKDDYFFDELNSISEIYLEDIIASDNVGYSENILSTADYDNNLKRGDNSILDENNSLPSAIDYTLKSNASDTVSTSSVRIDIIDSDDTTTITNTTTDTITREVPSVIISRQYSSDFASLISSTDFDSLLSFDDESKTRSPRSSVECKVEKKTNAPPSRKIRGKSGSVSSNENSRSKNKLKEKRSKKKIKKKNLRNDGVSREVKKHKNRDTLKEKKSKKKNLGGVSGSNKTKSSQKKKAAARTKKNKDYDVTAINNSACSIESNLSELEELRNPATRVSRKSNEAENNSGYKMPKRKTVASSRTSDTGKSKQTRSVTTKRELDEKVGFGDGSVMNLIDKLKSFELGGQY